MEGTTGGVWRDPLADFAGYRGVGGWRGRLEGSGGTLWQILLGIGGWVGGGDDWRGLAGPFGRICRV